jgi:rhodanese-related sulfurtransferase
MTVGPPPGAPEVDIDELEQAMAEGAPVIDVRQADEYDAAHVPGARLIPLGEVAYRIGEVPTEGPVYVICQTGARSLKAAEFYRARGIDARNVAGGTKAWVESGRQAIRGPHSG